MGVPPVTFHSTDRSQDFLNLISNENVVDGDAHDLDLQGHREREGGREGRRESMRPDTIEKGTGESLLTKYPMNPMIRKPMIVASATWRSSGTAEDPVKENREGR